LFEKAWLKIEQRGKEGTVGGEQKKVRHDFVGPVAEQTGWGMPRMQGKENLGKEKKERRQTLE